MKYIVMPILKLLFVVVVMLLVYPFIILCSGLIALWHWEKKELVDAIKFPFTSFLSSDEFTRIGQKYYYYKNPIDYLRDIKSWTIKKLPQCN